MANNTVLNVGAGGDTMRDVDRAGVKTPVVGIDLGIGTGTEVLMTGAMPVSGTFWQATQPVSIASPVAVTGTFWQTTQPISGNVGVTGSVAVTGTFFQATQPVSGTVAATQSGSWSVTIGAGSAVIGHVIVDSGTVAATQSGTWNVGTVTTVTTVATVTTITNSVTVVNAGTFAVQNTAATPAGTNLIGKISASHETATIYNGTTALTPKFAVISLSATGTVVAAVGGKSIRVLRWSLSSNGAVNVKWQSAAGPTDLTGLHYLTQFASAGGAYCPVGIFQTISGEALNLNLSAAIAVGGEITYVEV